MLRKKQVFKNIIVKNNIVGVSIVSRYKKEKKTPITCVCIIYSMSYYGGLHFLGCWKKKLET